MSEKPKTPPMEIQPGSSGVAPYANADGIVHISKAEGCTGATYGRAFGRLRSRSRGVMCSRGSATSWWKHCTGSVEAVGRLVAASCASARLTVSLVGIG